MSSQRRQRRNGPRVFIETGRTPRRLSRVGPRTVSLILSCLLKHSLNQARTKRIKGKSRSFPMFAFTRKSSLTSSNSLRKRSTRPLLENLEDRLLLYTLTAAHGPMAAGLPIVSCPMAPASAAPRASCSRRLTPSLPGDVGGAIRAGRRPCGRPRPTSTSPWSPTAASRWHQRRSARRPAVRRHPHRHGHPRLRHAGRDVPAPAGQWRNRCRRHAVQLPASWNINSTYDLDDRGDPRVRPRFRAWASLRSPRPVCTPPTTGPSRC